MRCCWAEAHTMSEEPRAPLLGSPTACPRSPSTVTNCSSLQWIFSGVKLQVPCPRNSLCPGQPEAVGPPPSSSPLGLTSSWVLTPRPLCWEASCFTPATPSSPARLCPVPHSVCTLRSCHPRAYCFMCLSHLLCVSLHEEASPMRAGMSSLVIGVLCLKQWQIHHGCVVKIFLND